MKPRSLVMIAVVLVFVAFLAWTTLSAQKVDCRVCVTYLGRTNCATASHENREEALRAAQTTACGPLTGGVDQAIACQRAIPETAECHSK